MLVTLLKCTSEKTSDSTVMKITLQSTLNK